MKFLFFVWHSVVIVPFPVEVILDVGKVPEILEEVSAALLIGIVVLGSGVVPGVVEGVGVVEGAALNDLKVAGAQNLVVPCLFVAEEAVASKVASVGRIALDRLLWVGILVSTTAATSLTVALLLLLLVSGPRGQRFKLLVKLTVALQLLAVDLLLVVSQQLMLWRPLVLLSVVAPPRVRLVAVPLAEGGALVIIEEVGVDVFPEVLMESKLPLPSKLLLQLLLSPLLSQLPPQLPPSPLQRPWRRVSLLQPHDIWIRTSFRPDLHALESCS